MSENATKELLVDFIISLDGYASAEGWPGWWGLEGPEYLRWLREQPEGDYTILMGARTYRQMAGFAAQREDAEMSFTSDEEASIDEVAKAPKVVFSSTMTEPLGAVVRYLENGFPDPAFAPNGRVALPGDNVGRGLAVQSDGKILLAGSVNVGTPLVPLNRFAVMRLLANGTIDDSFGTRGRVQTQFTDRGDDAFGVGVQADDKIVAAGRSSSQLNSNFAIARYESNGAIDTSFDQDGKLTIDFLGSTDIAENVAIQSNGKIVLGGIARDSVDGYGVARVLP